MLFPFSRFSSLSARLSFVHPERYSLMKTLVGLGRDDGKLGEKRKDFQGGGWGGGRSKLDNG